MKNYLTRILFVACVILLSGCFRINYRLDAIKGNTYRTERWDNFFLFGLVPVQESFDQRGFCRADKLVMVRTEQKPANVLSGILGLGLTSARTVEATCLISK